MIGLGTTVGVMHFFKAAQPALLYLVPSCLGLPFLVALILGDLPALFRCVYGMWVLLTQCTASCFAKQLLCVFFEDQLKQAIRTVCTYNIIW